MALVIPPGFAQVAYRWTLGGDPEPMISTVGADLSSYLGDNQAAADDYKNAFVGAITAGGMTNEWVFIGVSLRIGQDGGPPVIAESTANLQGTNVAGNLPQNCCVLVRKASNLGGRSGRGRMYLPPYALAEGSVDGRGTLEAGFLAATQSNVTNWFTGLDIVLLHDSLAPGSPAPTPITNMIVDGRIATQRRRLRP